MRSRQARCFSVRRAQRAASSARRSCESSMLTLLSKRRPWQDRYWQRRPSAAQVRIARLCEKLAVRTPFLGMAEVAHLIEICRCHFMGRSEEHTSELQSLMRISYAVFCLKKQKKRKE